MHAHRHTRTRAHARSHILKHTPPHPHADRCPRTHSSLEGVRDRVSDFLTQLNVGGRLRPALRELFEFPNDSSQGNLGESAKRANMPERLKRRKRAIPPLMAHTMETLHVPDQLPDPSRAVIPPTVTPTPPPPRSLHRPRGVPLHPTDGREEGGHPQADPRGVSAALSDRSPAGGSRSHLLGRLFLHQHIEPPRSLLNLKILQCKAPLKYKAAMI